MDPLCVGDTHRNNDLILITVIMMTMIVVGIVVGTDNNYVKRRLIPDLGSKPILFRHKE